MARTNAGRKTSAPPPIPNCVDIIELQGKKLTVGDPIKVLSDPGKLNSYEGTVTRIRVNGSIVIDVWGGKGNKQKMRSLHPEQVEVYSTRKLNSIARKAAARAAAKAAGEEGPS